MREFLLHCSVPEFLASSCLFFALIYFGFGGVNWILTRYLLPRLGVGRALDSATPKPGQIRREILLSLVSILIFGTGAILPWGLVRLGWTKLPAEASLPRIVAETVLLLLWNETH